LIAPNAIHPVVGFCGILCIALGAGASGCLNMWWEHKIDGLMERTKNRPIPQGQIAPDSALAFGIILSSVSILIMAVGVGYKAACLLAFTIIFYVVVYTIYLKPRTPQNIVIGGLSGAMPPVIGWACSSNWLDPFPWILCAIIFFWTPAHFWALNLQLKSDYQKSGLPMLPNIVGEKITLRWILFYTFVTVIVSLAPCMLGFTGKLYLAISLLMGGYFIIRAGLLAMHKISTMQFFASSIYYLFGLFAGLLVDYYLR
jgi:protoheme IX farnesyltransferase